MTFEEWWSAEAAPGTHRGWEESCRQAYEVGRRAGLMCAAKKFESLLPTNWAYADGYANGADIAGELRNMAEEAAAKEGISISYLLDEMLAFDRAMVIAGYEKPQRVESRDGYLYERDADRFSGWLLRDNDPINI